MSEATTATLKYLVQGVNPTREAKDDLKNELRESLPNMDAVTVLPVVDGFSVEIEVADVAPFSRASFEPYVAEHILPDAVRLRCQPTGSVRLQLLKSKFS